MCFYQFWLFRSSLRRKSLLKMKRNDQRGGVWLKKSISFHPCQKQPTASRFNGLHALIMSSKFFSKIQTPQSTSRTFPGQPQTQTWRLSLASTQSPPWWSACAFRLEKGYGSLLGWDPQFFVSLPSERRLCNVSKKSFIKMLHKLQVEKLLISSSCNPLVWY